MQLYAATDTGDWTLGLVLFFAISIVLIQLLAAKPNNTIEGLRERTE